MVAGKENKPHIGIYGRRNVGKSALINNLAGQEISIVADFPGTTTDPVKRTFEIVDFGPVIFIDTAGIDDEGSVGELRVKKSLATTDKIDMAIVVISHNQYGEFEEKIISNLKEHKVPFIIIHNKSDVESINEKLINELKLKYQTEIIDYSTKDDSRREEIFELITKKIPDSSLKTKSLLGDIIKSGDIVLLITPIDTEAPAGRMILPQVQAIRDVLDNDCVAIVLKENAVEEFLQKTGIKPALAITDSQMFGRVDKMIDENIPLTGFSVVLAHHKGDFENYLKGTPHIDNLKDGDKILVLESCSHHVSCGDIGREKIPAWMRKYTGKKLEFITVAGLDNIPGSISDYDLLVQCGGCVLTKKQVMSRVKPAVDAGIPITNYGMLIAYVNGIFDRAVAPFVKAGI
ncbi:MAG: [FeFe] hydrogenase H-cluster maturation GTPase HydF [Bacteroidales bacterium]|nr:[FeFe] hydrogenase H-cluster maturation GTPase HydF [Bacteroidales bacterium]